MINPLYKFSISQTGQRFYKWICNPDKHKFLNNTLPTIETAICTGLYCFATEKQKDIPRDQKNLLQWQNVLGGIAGMCMGSFFNRKASNFVEQLAPKIDKNLIDVHKVKTGLAIGLPIAMTALTMRFIIPVLTTQVSTIIEDYRRAKRDKICRQFLEKKMQEDKNNPFHSFNKIA